SIVYTLYFLLATGDTFLRKLVQIVPGHPDKNRAVAMIRTIEGDIARYLSTVTFINAGLGAATAIAMYFLELVVGHRRRTDRGTDADGVEDRLRSRSEPRARRRTPERQARGTGD
ncbi:MAG: hypothetical protein HY322_18885, partial [Betaproteobacteria bacterium]|nr:hypothetical protein [Betaproteobacteria bacterium]